MSQPAQLPTPGTESERPISGYRREMQTRTMRWWYEAIIDDMLAQPFDTLEVRANRLNYSAGGLKMIINCDAFKAAFAARRERFATALEGAIQEKMGKVVSKGLDNILEQLETKRASLPFEKVAETTNSILEKLGYGAPKGSPGVQVNIQNNGGAGAQVPTTASAEVLQAARDKLRQTERAVMQEPLPQRPAPVSASQPPSFSSQGGEVIDAEVVGSSIEDLA